MNEYTRRTNLAFHDIARMRATLFDLMMKNYGLTQSQSWVLTHVVGNEGQTQKELAERMLVSTVALVGLVDRLEARGLVERHPDPTDRRAKRIFPTDEARSVSERIKPAMDQLDSIVYAGLTPEEIERYSEMQQIVKRNLRKELKARQSG